MEFNKRFINSQKLFADYYIIKKHIKKIIIAIIFFFLLYSTKLLLIGEVSVVENYSELQIFFEFTFDRKSQVRFYVDKIG